MAEIDKPPRKLLQDWRKRRAWVIYQVSIQGRSLAALARGVGVSKQSLYSAFRIPYPRMEKVIADAVGLTPQELFPERYDSDGLPNRKMGRPAGGPKSTAQRAKDTSNRKRRNLKSDGPNRQREGV